MDVMHKAYKCAHARIVCQILNHFSTTAAHVSAELPRLLLSVVGCHSKSRLLWYLCVILKSLKECVSS